MEIRKGSKEKAIIKEIQEVVGVEPDGIFGRMTEAAVIKWQRANHLVANGVVNSTMLEIMGILDTDQMGNVLITDNGLTIHKHHLPKGEYLEGPIKNEYAFIHHTAGWHNPYKVIDSWGRDSRGRIATEFVIGGQRVTDGNDAYDGEVVQAFPEGCNGYHLGKTGSAHMNTHSVAIELCAFGYLTDSGRTYVNGIADPQQISVLKEPFKGYTKWHKYSDAQIKSTELLLEFIAERDNIDLREGIVNWIRKYGPEKAFGFHQEAYEGKVKGLLTHTNVRKDKTDNFPQPELIDMLLSL